MTEALQIHIHTWQRADPELRAAEEVVLQCSWGHFHVQRFILWPHSFGAAVFYSGWRHWRIYKKETILQ